MNAERQRRRPGWPLIRTIMRDVTSHLGGWTLLFQQAGIFFDQPRQLSEMIIIGGFLLIGVPLVNVKDLRGTSSSIASPLSAEASPASLQPPSSSLNGSAEQ